jgi:hypothetical protein
MVPIRQFRVGFEYWSYGVNHISTHCCGRLTTEYITHGGATLTRSAVLTRHNVLKYGSNSSI